jgi:hypothetical protein
VTVKSSTLDAWQYENLGWLYPAVTFESLGYTTAEATFLKSLSYDLLLAASQTGHIAMP